MAKSVLLSNEEKKIEENKVKNIMNKNDDIEEEDI